MNLTVVAIASIGFFVAYTNGANDVSKGIATLAGSGVSSYRNATLWGALWTTCGSLAAIAFSGALVTTFGKGLLAASVSPTLPAAVAALIGAGLWVGLATRLELPVSTTHAIVGSIAGVMSVAYGTAGTNWHTLTGKIALPLVLSPLASLLLTIGLLKLRNRLSPQGADCLYAEIAAHPAVLASASADIPLRFPPLELSHVRRTNREFRRQC
jgi:PiT family inorganic phosphate transporter